ncbi:MAG: MBOAT family O-acyltransferase [Anaerolineales bacterium]|jgi:D-alanyl-lipoteichoic acid acyltransferase DltB (MBOAT superfamily)
MSIVQILIVLFVAFMIGAFLQRRSRLWAIFFLSLFCTYFFQPLVPLRNFDYWFPTFSILLTTITWFIVRKKNLAIDQDSLQAILFSILVIILVALIRYLPFELPGLPASPPPLVQITFLVVVSALIAALFSMASSRRLGSWIFIIVLVGIFILIKSEPMALWVSEHIRLLQGQSITLASTLDLHWLGFSYISFRLMHTLRDHQNGRLPENNLREFMTFVLFFPALVAGPIDRLERFIKDLRFSDPLSGDRTFEGSRRIVIGLLKKFVLADALAAFALNSTNASFMSSPLWTWIVLYAYAFRIFLDFSGYTDIAIGIGLFSGIKLPENFDRPYLQSNLTSFWNSWHITLARWFRSYFFNPVTRWLRSGPLRNLPALIILVGQVGTMALIGLWHGITWNFLIWGLWHGIGLFIHNRWVNYLRTHRKPVLIARLPTAVTRALGTVLTFHFTALGWVWFALPEVGVSLKILGTLFGRTG